MYLKSLVLKGFKSFADRSVISLEPGIAAIVGPNGSGKSNISDAVLWVLGERNAKNLRGQAMEDVIFAGSSARKSVGIAEVDLVLDNTDGTLSVDFSEVVITRRMYRSGESEYLINGTVVRRLDILDILHDSGLGSGTHSIISQGNLDSILQSKPEDRRALIEEAAGVLKHKQRKQKSERKLQQMDAHLTRVSDIAEEVSRQLKPLERKAKRAQAYQELAGNLAELNLVLAIDELRILQTKWGTVTAQEKTLLAEIDEARELIEEKEKLAENFQEDIQAKSANVSEIARRYRQAQSIMERFDATTLLLREKQRTNLDYETVQGESLESNQEKYILALKNKEEVSEQLTEVEKEKRGAEQEATRLSDFQKDVLEKISAHETERMALRQTEKATQKSIEDSKNAQSEAKELLSNNLAHEKLITNHGKELETQLDNLTQEHQTMKINLDGLTESLAILKTKETEARDKVGASHAQREYAREAYEQTHENQILVSSEIKAFEEYNRANIATNPALTWLLENIKNNSDARPLAEIISVPADIEALVEKLLKKDVDALLVEDITTINHIADKLSTAEEQGEVVLFPRKKALKSEARQAKVLNRFEALATPLLSLISYPDNYIDVIVLIFGTTYLCDTKEDAFRCYDKGEDGERFVTRDGLILEVRGKASIGFDASPEEGVLARHRHLEELRNQLEILHLECAERLKMREVSDEALRTAQGESLRLSQELAQLQGKTDSARKEEKRAEDKLMSLRREYEALEKQCSEAKEIVTTTRPVTIELEEKIKNLTEKLQETHELIGVKTAELVPLRKQHETGAANLSEARLKLAKLVERESYLQRILVAREQDIVNLIEEKQTLISNHEKKHLAKTRIEPLLSLLARLHEGANRWIVELEKATLAEEHASADSHASLLEARQEARAAHDAFEAINTNISQVRVDKGRLEIQVESAVDTIVKDCKTSLDNALTYPILENRAEEEDRAFKLRRRIANMGTINPDAAMEYEELKTRYDYMATQLDDLKSARRSLTKIVRVIDARMKDDFIKTFELVNANFEDVFRILFPGGSASLSLVDPDDPEHTGIEIVAQPRGKKITKMTLMSGGEKSLTALALLFAVYHIRSTPFYILDEVEAALDDSNLRRLCSYLDSLRGNTQLILITHQRRTMEMADILYGISMQADGVTRIVSQKLDKALQHAEG